MIHKAVKEAQNFRSYRLLTNVRTEKFGPLLPYSEFWMYVSNEVIVNMISMTLYFNK